MPMRQQVQNRLPLLQQQVQTKKDALTTAAVQNIALTAAGASNLPPAGDQVAKSDQPVVETCTCPWRLAKINQPV